MNILDYLEWRGDLSFARDALNEVDMLIFAWLAYYDFGQYADRGVDLDGLTLRELAELHVRENGPFAQINPAKTIYPSVTAAWLLHCASGTERFAPVRLRDFRQVADRAKSVQFAAASFLIGDSHRIIAYRGTDSTVAGWKEDCQLSFMEAVPAQRLAVQYLEENMDGRETAVCGHSKGGNLAVYAALHVSDSKLDGIRRVYNFDGPGFCFNLQNLARYELLKERIITIVPESSVIGMMLEHEEDYRIVESQMSGILQHDALFWKVMRSGFVYSDKLSRSSVVVDKTLHDWLKQISPDERREFVDVIFSVIEGSGVEKLSELSEKTVQKGIRMLTAATTLSRQQRKMALRLLLNLVKTGNVNLYASVVNSDMAAELTRGLDTVRHSGVVTGVAKGIQEGRQQIADAVDQGLGAIETLVSSKQGLLDRLKPAKAEAPSDRDQK